LTEAERKKYKVTDESQQIEPGKSTSRFTKRNRSASTQEPTTTCNACGAGLSGNPKVCPECGNDPKLTGVDPNDP
jgi:rubrerythrin